MQYVRGIGQSQQAPQAAPVKEVTQIAGLTCCSPMQEPCRSYVLRDVICMFCNHCTDLDLCRDPALQVRCHSMKPDTVCFLKQIGKAHTLALPFMSTDASCMLCSNWRHLRCEDRVRLAPELLRVALDASKPWTTPQTAAASGSNVRRQPEWHQDHQELVINSYRRVLSCQNPLWCPQAHQWGCKACGNAYDLAAIEAQLVRAVRLKARAFQLQDLRCTKCRQVAAPQPATCS